MTGVAMPKGWSFKDDRRVMERARSSKSLDEIAKAMDVTPDRIRKVAVRLGVSVRSKPKRNEMTGKVRSPKISWPRLQRRSAARPAPHRECRFLPEAQDFCLPPESRHLRLYECTPWHHRSCHQKCVRALIPRRNTFV